MCLLKMQLYRVERRSLENLLRSSQFLIHTTGLESKTRSVYTRTCAHITHMPCLQICSNTHIHTTYRSEYLIVILGNTHQQVNAYFQINFSNHSLQTICTNTRIVQPYIFLFLIFKKFQ